MEVVDLAGETSSVTPVKAVFGSISTLLAMIGVRLLLSCNGLLRAHTPISNHLLKFSRW